MQAVWVAVVGTVVAAAAVDTSVKPHLEIRGTIPVTSAQLHAGVKAEWAAGNDSEGRLQLCQ